MLSDRRTGVPFIGVIATNGDSVSSNLTLNAAADCRHAGVTLLTVAAGDWLDRYVLSAIASYPYWSNMIIAPQYLNLTEDAYVQALTRAICNSKLCLIRIKFNRNGMPKSIQYPNVVRKHYRP